MALPALGRSRCSICGEVLQPGQLIVGTTHFIGDPADHLWQFSDSGMHAECFAGWAHRDEFASRYHAALGRTLAGWVPAVPSNPGGPPLPKVWMRVLKHARGAGRILRGIAVTYRPRRRINRCSRRRGRVGFSRRSAAADPPLIRIQRRGTLFTAFHRPPPRVHAVRPPAPEAGDHCRRRSSGPAATGLTSSPAAGSIAGRQTDRGPAGRRGAGATRLA